MRRRGRAYISITLREIFQYKDPSNRGKTDDSPMISRSKDVSNDFILSITKNFQNMMLFQILYQGLMVNEH